MFDPDTEDNYFTRHLFREKHFPKFEGCPNVDTVGQAHHVRPTEIICSETVDFTRLDVFSHQGIDENQSIITEDDVEQTEPVSVGSLDLVIRISGFSSKFFRDTDTDTVIAEDRIADAQNECFHD